MILKIMMKSYNYISLFVAALLCGLSASSCSDESSDVETSDSQEVRFLVKVADDVSVQVGSRAGDEEENSIFDRFPVGVDFVAGRSRISVCSVDRSPGSANYLPDYNNEYPKTAEEQKLYPNRYHAYICKTRREYEEYSDFVCYGDAISLQWDKVDENTGERIPNTGNILRTNEDGGFYMFAAMYPYTYTRPVIPGTGLLYVRDDQRYDPATGAAVGHFAANLLVNDIRLCQKKFGYDHFRMPIQLDFFHSLCMLVVNVKVPLYHQSDGLGFTIDQIAGAWPPTMNLDNIWLSYKPDYDHSYDKSEAVIVNGDKTYTGTIKMFNTPNFRCPDNTVISTFKTEDSYVFDEEVSEGVNVPVMWMQFCAILPFQQLTDANSDACIIFNIAGKKYSCHFSKISEPVKLEQGHVTIVSMYIPRGDSDPILVGAKLKNWERKRTPIVSLQ